MTSDDAPENQGSKTELPARRQGQSKSERGEFAAIEDPRLERSLKHDRGEFIEDSGDEEIDEEDLEWDAEVDVDGSPNDYATAAEWEQRTQSHPEGEGTKFRSTSDPTLRKRHVKRKKVKRKRKNREAVPGWDRDAAAEEEQARAGEAEGTDHAGLQKAAKGTSSAKTRHRSKGRRKRRKGGSKIERVLVVSPKIIAILATVVVSVVIIVGTFGLHRIARLVPGISIPDPSRGGSNPVPFSDVFVPDEADVRAAREVLDQYFEADGWEAKLAFVRKPQEVRPLMKEWYDSPRHLGEDQPRSISQELLSKQERNTGFHIISFAVELSPSYEIQFCAVEKTREGKFLVDWEVTEGHQRIPLSEFKDRMPQTPVEFRVHVKDGDYYNGVFLNQDEWKSYRLSYPGDLEFSIWGYVRRGTPLEDEMNRFVSSASSSSLKLNLLYPANADDPNLVEIGSIVSANWFQ